MHNMNYKTQHNGLLLEKILLNMNYDSRLTKKENLSLVKEQLSTDGYIDVKNSAKVEGYVSILTPDKKAMLVPKGTQIMQLADQEYYLELITSTSLKSWVDKSKGGEGNSTTDSWIPSLQEWPQIVASNSVVEFKTPDGKKYNATYKHPQLEKLTTGSEIYNMKANPLGWKFVGYEDTQGKAYIQPNSNKSESWVEWAWDGITDNWEIILQIGVSLVVGVLTGGMSLVTQALIQLGIDVAFALKQLLVDKDSVGATISFIVGLIPVAGRLGKFGVRDVAKFLKVNKGALSRIRTLDDFEAYFKSLNPPDQLLLTRALKQTPGELKQATSKALVKSLEQGLKNKTIQLSKIPAKQLLWWKQVFIEGGLSLTTAVGLQIGITIYKLKKMFKEAEEKYRSGKGLNLSVDEKQKADVESMKNKYKIEEPKVDSEEEINRVIELMSKEEDPFG